MPNDKIEELAADIASIAEVLVTKQGQEGSAELVKGISAVPTPSFDVEAFKAELTSSLTEQMKSVAKTEFASSLPPIIEQAMQPIQELMTQFNTQLSTPPATPAAETPPVEPPKPEPVTENKPAPAADDARIGAVESTMGELTELVKNIASRLGSTAEGNPVQPVKPTKATAANTIDPDDATIFGTREKFLEDIGAKDVLPISAIVAPANPSPGA